ncbi:AraC-like DNA-binding protein [Constrictibacter sp. MBR-5]|jgi:AraC-like DNA-binding protein|uniref:hypothetical protein n=1 Tax=Constrictibacter sp. MBR-5 TaxID=3156467 RepID=UPI00339387BD
MRIAARLRFQSGAGPRATVRPARSAVFRARDDLDGRCFETVRSKDIETVTRLDRYELARHFRSAFGIPPGRWLAMRKT